MKARSFRWRAMMSAAACGVLATTGCFQPEPATHAQLARGLLVMLPGIEGSPSQFAETCKGLRAVGVNCAIQIHDWNRGPFGSLANLTDLEGNRRRAATIAGQIVDYQKRYPDRPVTLVGYSGGGALALFTCEALPDGVQLERVILLAAGISPGYDLAPALARSRRGLVNFYSKGDWWTLGVFTGLFGTLDRRRTPAAGHVGFCDPDGDLLMCPGLIQIRWIPAWWRLGHGGGHIGWLARDWAREVLAPAIPTRADILRQDTTTCRPSFPPSHRPMIRPERAAYQDGCRRGKPSILLIDKETGPAGSTDWPRSDILVCSSAPTAGASRQ